MEMNGFTVDEMRLQEMERELSLKADELEQSIYDDAGEVFNINSPKQLGQILKNCSFRSLKRQRRDIRPILPYWKNSGTNIP